MSNMEWLQSCTSADETALCSDGNTDLDGVDHIRVMHGERAERDEVRGKMKRKLRQAKRALKRSKEAASAAGEATQERLRLLEKLCWERFEADDDDDDAATVVAPLFEESFKPIDRLYEIADESFYFRVQCMLLYAPLTPDTFFCCAAPRPPIPPMRERSP